jgi:predicted phosphohydrolase
MNVWAISDLHLSFARSAQRERYAARWRDHAAKIEVNWHRTVGRDDVVLLPGDTSMAGNHRDLQPDLEWLERLPGTKVISRGNHDRWWNDVAAIRRMLRRSIRAVDGDAIALDGMVVCGTAGALVPSDHDPAADRTEVERQIEAIRNALAHAASLRSDRPIPLYVLWHYPPFDVHGRPGPWVELFEQARVTACIYGHLHSQSEWPAAVQGVVRGVRYHCGAADAIGFCPLRIDRVEKESASS